MLFRSFAYVSLPSSSHPFLCTAVVDATARTRNKMALFMTFVGRVLVGKRRRTRRCVSVDLSLLSALDLRVKARPLVRVRAVLTPVTPREGVNPSSQQYSSLNTAAHRRIDGGDLKLLSEAFPNSTFNPPTSFT